MIATRVSGDPVSGNNGLSYFYSDHLGSASALQKPNATMAYTWYLPFGGYRPGSAPTQTITDRDFTGQRENMELGLLYYNARFYAPTLGRFISADSIVPNPANPQSYNRYSYVLNRALNFTDPTGHRECDIATGDCSGGPGSFTPPQYPTPLYEGENSIVSFSPIEQVPDGWRTVQVNYRELFGSYATNSAPNRSVYIYYQQDVTSTQGLLPFEIVARVLLGENTRGLLFDNPIFADEVSEHWPQDQVAPAYIISRNAMRSNESIAEHVGPNRTANPILNVPDNPSQGLASDRAHIIALGADQGWLVDPSFGADWYFHQEKNPSFDNATYLDDTWVGDWAAGTYWQPGYGSTRTVYPFNIESSTPSPYN
jgi:RHS repeat-associated protein